LHRHQRTSFCHLAKSCLFGPSDVSYAHYKRDNKEIDKNSSGLFVRFFIRSYSRRGASAKNPTHRRRGSKALQDAARGVERELDSLGKSAEDGFGDVANNIKRVVSNNTNNANSTPKSADKRRVSATIEHAWEVFEKGSEEAITDVKDTIKRNGSAKASSLKKKSSEGHDKLRSLFENGEANSNRSVDSPAQDGVKKTKQTAEAAKDNTKSFATDAVERLEEAAEASVKKTKEAVGMAQESAASGVEAMNEAINGDYKTIAEDITERSQSLRNNDETESETKEDAKEDATTEESSSRSDSVSELSRQSSSQSQSQARDPSPRKSKIPQPKTARSRSPIKKLAANTSSPRTQSRSSSFNTNGTKSQQNSLNSQNSASRSNSNGDDSLPAASPSKQDRSSSSSTTTSNKDAQTNSGVSKQDPSSANSAELEDSGVLVDEDSEKTGAQSENDRQPSSKHSDAIAGKQKGEETEKEGLSSTDPKEDGASFAEKVQEEG
jgi:hypothetical protein